MLKMLYASLGADVGGGVPGLLTSTCMFRGKAVMGSDIFVVLKFNY